mmetsp:Transcript_26619/g.92520  ORF Transcript_26619/g.92520 Transcript_26619/m.92520 type:complete len:222 (-) Transcript_26619:2361-3026(-)
MLAMAWSFSTSTAITGPLFRWATCSSMSPAPAACMASSIAWSSDSASSSTARSEKPLRLKRRSALGRHRRATPSGLTTATAKRCGGEAANQPPSDVVSTRPLTASAPPGYVGSSDSSSLKNRRETVACAARDEPSDSTAHLRSSVPCNARSEFGAVRRASRLTSGPTSADSVAAARTRRSTSTHTGPRRSAASAAATKGSSSRASAPGSGSNEPAAWCSWP